jgi:hypothetical protein
MDVPTSFIWKIVLFDEFFQYSDSINSWGYFGTNNEPLFVDLWSLCNVIS